MSKTASRSLKQAKIAIVGGGCGGMTLSSQLIKSGKFSSSDITIFDPTKYHYYQPGFTLLSGGLLGKSDMDVHYMEDKILKKEMKELYANNVKLIPESVVEIDPEQNKIYTSNSDGYQYDYLILNTGLKLRYDLIEGAEDALNDHSSKVGSMYKISYAKKLNTITQEFKSGRAVATQPHMPIKCGGAPQKYAYLADALWRKQNTRSDIDFHFFTALPVMFPVQKYNESLEKIVVNKNINVHKQMDICKVDHLKNKVYFKDTKNDKIVEEHFDMLNIVPPQRAPEIECSTDGFFDGAGFLDLNKETLQNNKYENVFGLGDCTNLPTSKTAAAVFQQTPVLVNNLLRHMNGESLNAKYNGYTSCPILMGDNKVLLAEFLYGNVPDETFGKYLNQSNPQTAFYFIKRYMFPFAYWHLVPRSLWYGRKALTPPKFA